MKTWKHIATALVTAVALTLAPAVAQDKPSKVGKVLGIKGPRLETNRNTDSGKWYQAYPKMATFLAEHLKTDAATTATIEFAIGGQAVISPGTEVEVVSKDGVEKVGNKLVVKSGALWAKIDRQSEQLQIQTSGGTMGIEGTEFFIETQPDGSTKLVVVEGKVKVTDSQGGTGTYTLGQRANFGSGSLVSGTYYSGSSIFDAREAALGEVDPALAGVLRPLMNRVLYRLPLREIGYAEAAIAFIMDPEKALNDQVEREARALWARGPGRGISTPFGSTPGAPFPEPKPVRGLRAEGDTPKFSWENRPDAGNYAIVIAKDNEGKQPVWYGESKSGDSFTYPAYGPELERGSYHWFLTPLNDDGKPKEWSITGMSPKSLAAQSTFFTNGHTPKYGTVGEVKHGSSFSWGKVNGAKSYMVQVAMDQAMDLILLNDRTEKNDYTYPSDARPLEAGEHFVRVEALDEWGFKMAESVAVAFTK